MIKTKRCFKKFATDNSSDMEEYEDILNNPLCTITDKIVEKEKRQEYNDRGNLIQQQDIIYFLGQSDHIHSALPVVLGLAPRRRFGDRKFPIRPLPDLRWCSRRVHRFYHQ